MNLKHVDNQKHLKNIKDLTIQSDREILEEKIDTYWKQMLDIKNVCLFIFNKLHYTISFY